jgi:hypothetical protein
MYIYIYIYIYIIGLGDLGGDDGRGGEADSRDMMQKQLEEISQKIKGVRIMHCISRSFNSPVFVHVLDWVCVFIRETIQRVDFVIHML